MKIAVISYYLPPTDYIGAGVQANDLANEYVRAGHDVTVFTACDKHNESTLYRKITLRSCGNLRTFKFAIAVGKLSFSQFDYVHAIGEDYLISRRNRNVLMHSYMGSCKAESNHAVTKSERFRLKLVGYLEDVSYRKSDICTVISPSTLQYIPGYAHVVPCGIDRRIFKPGTKKTQFPSCLFVGVYLSRKRGQELHTEFVNHVLPAIPNATLNVVREQNVPPHPSVASHGYISVDKLVSLYQSSWVFCLPSSYEGFGVPYVEALSTGTSIVYTPNEGGDYVLDNGKYAVRSNIDSLGYEISSLLQDDEKRNRLSAQGIERSTLFDLHRIASTYVNLVEQYVN